MLADCEVWITNRRSATEIRPECQPPNYWLPIYSLISTSLIFAPPSQWHGNGFLTPPPPGSASYFLLYAQVCGHKQSCLGWEAQYWWRTSHLQSAVKRITHTHSRLRLKRQTWSEIEIILTPRLHRLKHEHKNRCKVLSTHTHTPPHPAVRGERSGSEIHYSSISLYSRLDISPCHTCQECRKALTEGPHYWKTTCASVWKLRLSVSFIVSIFQYLQYIKDKSFIYVQLPKFCALKDRPQGFWLNDLCVSLYFRMHFTISINFLIIGSIFFKYYYA